MAELPKLDTTEAVIEWSTDAAYSPATAAYLAECVRLREHLQDALIAGDEVSKQRAAWWLKCAAAPDVLHSPPPEQEAK